MILDFSKSTFVNFYYSLWNQPINRGVVISHWLVMYGISTQVDDSIITLTSRHEAWGVVYFLWYDKSSRLNGYTV